MITNKDLESICNYSEITKPSMGTTANVMYIDFDLDGEYERELTRKKRDYNINSVLGEEQEDPYFNPNDGYLSEKSPLTPGIPAGGSSMYSVIGPKVRTLTIQSTPFISLQKLQDDIILYYEKVTQNPMVLPNYMNHSFNYNITNNPKLSSYDNFQANFRKIISRTLSCSSLIATNGRIGPATAAIVGSNAAKHFDDNYISNNGTLGGINIMYSPLISPNKVILVRGSKIDHPGLIVINNLNDKIYFMAETPNNKQISWFDVI